MEARSGTFVVKDEDDEEDEDNEAFNCPRRDDRKMREEDNRRKEDIFAFDFTLCARACACVCVYRSRGRRFYRSGRLLVTCGVSDVKEALVWAKSKKIKIIKNVVCVISRAALNSSSSLHSSISRFNDLLLDAAFVVVAVTVLTIIIGIESVPLFC